MGSPFRDHKVSSERRERQPTSLKPVLVTVEAAEKKKKKETKANVIKTYAG